MDPELRDTLAKIYGEVAEGTRLARQGVSIGTEALKRISRAERTLYGKSLPPPNDQAPAGPVRISEPDPQEVEIVNGGRPATTDVVLLGRIEAVEAAVAETLRINREQAKVMAIPKPPEPETAKTIATQLRAAWAFSASREGRKQILGFIAFVFIVYGTVQAHRAALATPASQPTTPAATVSR